MNRLSSYNPLIFIVNCLAILSFVEVPIIPIPLSVGVMIVLALCLKYSSFSHRQMFLMFLFTVFEMMKTFFWGCPNYSAKVITTLILIFLLSSAMKNVTRSFVPSDKIQTELVTAMKFIMLILLIDVSLDSAFSQSDRASGRLFHEPSHLGFILAPVVIFMLLEQRILFAALGGIILMLGFSSSTALVIFSSLLLIYSTHIKRLFLQFKLQKYLLVLIVCTIPIFTVAFLNPEFIDRIVDVLSPSSGSDEKNMSSVVYLNGWLQALAYLKDTYGMGVGIANMGCSGGITTELSLLVEDLSGGIYLNYNDGSFLISKMLSELGMVTTVIIVLYLINRNVLAIHYLFVYRTDPELRSVMNLIAALLIPNTLYLFIRGAGFFESQVLFIILGHHMLLRVTQLKGLR